MRHLQCVQVHFEPERLWSEHLRKVYEVVVQREERNEPADTDASRRLRVSRGKAEREGRVASSEPEEIDGGIGTLSVDDALVEAMGARGVSVKVPPGPSQHDARQAA